MANKKQISLKTWLINYDAGTYNSKDVNTQIKAGWYDWFVKNDSLQPRLKKMAPKLKKIAKSRAITALGHESVYVWFKNNCPGVGTVYDDFRIASIETGDTLFTICPSSGHESEKGKSSVWGVLNNWSAPLAEGTWKDVTDYFGV